MSFIGNRAINEYSVRLLSLSLFYEEYITVNNIAISAAFGLWMFR